MPNFGKGRDLLLFSQAGKARFCPRQLEAGQASHKDEDRLVRGNAQSPVSSWQLFKYATSSEESEYNPTENSSVLSRTTNIRQDARRREKVFKALCKNLPQRALLLFPFTCGLPGDQKREPAWRAAHQPALPPWRGHRAPRGQDGQERLPSGTTRALPAGCAAGSHQHDEQSLALQGAQRRAPN